MEKETKFYVKFLERHRFLILLIKFIVMEIILLEKKSK